MLHEAMKQGTRGAHHESLLTVTDWGFHLNDIQMPVQIWHGEADKNIPVEMARYAATTIPNLAGRADSLTRIKGSSELAGLEVAHRLHQLRLRVHHEGPVADVGLGQRLGREEQEAGLVRAGVDPHHDEKRYLAWLLALVVLAGCLHANAGAKTIVSGTCSANAAAIPIAGWIANDAASALAALSASPSPSPRSSPLADNFRMRSSTSKKPA